MTVYDDRMASRVGPAPVLVSIHRVAINCGSFTVSAEKGYVMTTYQAPGVHIKQETPAPGPIQGASTSVAAFVGVIQSEPAPGVHAVTSYRGFLKLFEDMNRDTLSTDNGFGLLANGVYGFFNNGGTRCYVTWVSSEEGSTPPSTSSDEVEQLLSDAKASVMARLEEHDAPSLTGAQQNKLQTLLSNIQGLSKDELVNDLTAWLQGLNWKTVATDAAELIEKSLDSLMNLIQDLENALDRAQSAVQSEELSKSKIGSALLALEPYDDISIVAAPGLTDKKQWDALAIHCTDLNRFAVLDAPFDSGWASSNPDTGELPARSDYAAIYYPWIKVAPANGGDLVSIPPSGHVAGVYARVDAQRGVFKAPANESVYGALDLATYVSTKQQAQLNDPLGVNCIRRLNGGILIWGARTVQAPDNDLFKYVSTTRTFNYIRQSLESGMQWAVFEPNTPALWGQIIRNATSFLTRLWQSGGLFGDTAAEAFYVKCDEDTNPPDVRALGQVVTEVGVAISQPAEFVVFKLGVTSGSATPTN